MPDGYAEKIETAVKRLNHSDFKEREKAVAALVEDTSDAYVSSINKAEEALSAFTTFAVRQAQLTQRAIEDGTRQAAEDLGTAIAIEQQSMLDPSLTGAEIASRLGLKAADVQRIVDTFALEVHVDADLSTASRQIEEFTASERITEIVGHAVLETADEDLTEFERRERITEIVAQAITEDANLDLQDISADRLADIIAIAITSNADGALNDTAGRERIADIIAQAATRDAEQQLAFVARDRSATISVGIAVTDAGNTIGGNILDIFNRWGGVTSYAQGGIHRQAMVGKGRGLVHWDEPETGGEAYVPRNGNPRRSLAVLGEAASWYGMALAPKALNQQPPAPARVPYGGALVPGASSSVDNSRTATIVQNFHEAYRSPATIRRQTEAAIGTYG